MNSTNEPCNRLSATWKFSRCRAGLGVSVIRHENGQPDDHASEGFRENDHLEMHSHFQHSAISGTHMKSMGLAITLSILTGTFIAADLSAVEDQALQPALYSPVNSLAIMPNSMPGLAVARADIRDGIFAAGSSTGNEGLFESTEEASDYEDNSDGLPVSPEPPAEDDWVLI